VNVLVDTSVWSLAFRRDKPLDGAHERELIELIREGRVALVGPVRQELLSGVRVASQCLALSERLRAFAELEVETADYERAAECFNRCRARGVQGSNADFLICAICLRRDIPVFTTDRDFGHYARVLGIKLHAPRKTLHKA
jgi:predicted nucleic acid-binding protein